MRLNIDAVQGYFYTMDPPKTYMFRGFDGKQPAFLGGQKPFVVHGFGGSWYMSIYINIFVYILDIQTFSEKVFGPVYIYIYALWQFLESQPRLKSWLWGWLQ